MLKRIGLFIAAISPGLFLIGYNIGTGSITTMAAAGAQYGMSLTLPLALSCIFTYTLIIAFSRYTIVTGKTALQSFREHFGTGWAVFVLVSLLFSEWVSSAGVMAVVTQVVQEWSRPLTASGEGWSTLLLAILFGVLLYALFLNGSHRFFEKVLAVFVGLMGLSFVLTMFMVIPEPMEVIKGLVPRLPQDSDTALLTAGMVGTTMGAILYVVRSILVQEKGWTLNDLKAEKRDAAISASMMFLLSIAVMASAAGTLFPRGLAVNNAIDMVVLLEPLAGKFAVSLFVFGIVAAGLSSLFPIILLAPWLIADFRSTKRDMRSKSSRWLVLLGVLFGLTVPIFGGRPVFVMILSQALAAVASPVVLILMGILLNKKEIMGEHVASKSTNAWLIIAILFTAVMAVSGIVGIIGLF